MLDSTLGKILTSGEVDKSLQGKTPSNASETIVKPLAVVGEQQSSECPSEAEVRLVFKFSVEEHLIYKGKVERVQQLQNEELSRLVSRVAWNGTKDSEDIEDAPKKDKTTQIDDTNNDLKRQHKGYNQRSLSTQTNETSFPPHLSYPTPGHSSQATSTNQNETGSNGISSHLQSCLETKTGPSSERNLEDCSIAQTKQSSLETTTCDNSNNGKLSTNHIHLVDVARKSTKEFRLSTKLEESQNLPTINFNDYERGRQQDISQDQIDMQSITDALEDCLDSVDFEINHREPRPKAVPQINGQAPTNKLDNKALARENSMNKGSHFKKTYSSQVIGAIADDIENKKLHTNVIHKTTGTAVALVHTTQMEIPNQQSYNEKNNQNEKVFNTVPSIVNTTQTTEKETTATSNPSNVKKKASLEQSSPSTSSSTKLSATAKRVRKGTPKDQRNLSLRKATPSKPSTTNNAGKSSNFRQIESMSPSIPTTTNTNSFTNQNDLFSSDESGSKPQTRYSNKVFAKWTDNHYYPGTILRQAKDRKFLIGFLDGAQRNVAEIDLIPITNIEGRQVRVSIAKNYCVNALVHGQSEPINEQPMFDVEYQQDVLIRKSVPFKDLFLTGDQGSLLINQVDRSSGCSNFADVDLDNIIYEKRSRRLQDMDDFELAEGSPASCKKKRKYNMRNCNSTKPTNNLNTSSASPAESLSSPASSIQSKRNSHNDINHDPESNFQCTNSPSESSTGSSNVALELGQEFYFANSSPHRTKASFVL